MIVTEDQGWAPVPTLCNARSDRELLQELGGT